MGLIIRMEYDMLLRPLQDRLIAKRKQAETVTTNGLMLPTESQDKSFDAVVVAVGEGYFIDNGDVIPLEVKVGDVVMFSKHSGTELIIDDEEYLIFNESELLGIYSK